MESLEKQILSLSGKVEAIYAVIERLDMKLSQVLSVSSGNDGIIVPQVMADIIDDSLPNPEEELYEVSENLNFSLEWEHKDILSDVIYPEMNYQARDKQITPEIQIQRLTAQLTAAYHRIAALEEQLLRERVY